MSDESVLDGQECPRCRHVAFHRMRDTRYGPLLTCLHCSVSWLVPLVDVVAPKISATATWWRHE